jgi:hypothetical protein
MANGEWVDTGVLPQCGTHHLPHTCAIATMPA